MKRKIRMMRYSGSKFNFVEKLNLIISQTNKKIFIEPFVGSGAVFINTPDIFDEYIINDFSQGIISIWKAIKDFNYTDFYNEKEFIFNKFGDIKTNKESYYNFRNWYNENYYFSEKTERGIYLYFLANSYINSMLRFGPNGMNQSFGKCFYFIDSFDFNEIKNKLNKKNILNTSYENLTYEDSILFLDPPYFERNSSYKHFDINDNDKFVKNIIKYSEKNDILYTDIFNYGVYKKINNFKIRMLRNKMRNTNPNSKKEIIDNKEVLYYILGD